MTSSRSLTFAVDFDGTYAADPDLFCALIMEMERRGHRAVIVTGRSDTPPWNEEVRAAIPMGIPVVFAGAHWKRVAAMHAGYRVDIWIDDNPEYIGPQDPSLAGEKG